MLATNLSSPLTALSGVGPALAKTLSKLGLQHVEDLLFLLPLRYEDRSKLVKLGALNAGTRCLVEGEVLLAEVAFRGRRNLLVRLGDGSGQITLRYFYFSRQQQSQFAVGTRVSAFGDIRTGAAGLEMVHPEYRILKADQKAAQSDTLTPVYPMTEGIQQGRLRNLAAQAIRLMQATPPKELLPDEVREKLSMPLLTEALTYLHQPPTDADIRSLSAGQHPCQKRLAFEELLAHYLSLSNLRLRARKDDADALTKGGDVARKFVAELPFALTSAQQRVVEEILSDIKLPHPMMRLVQGDVGSGKTIVAAIACLHAIESGVQAAVMAPTELLAEQHYRNFSDWFTALGCAPVWLSGSQRAAAKRRALQSIRSGEARLAVGTHALFQDGVEFKKLGLVVIDEQHRFGVHQRMALREKGALADRHPHQLVMTATPIPRTLAMAAYADLDVSIIDELPPGRKPVQTVVLPDDRRGDVVARVRDACLAGRQAYWVCPLIEESELLDFQAAEASFDMLKTALPELRVGLIHGRMKSAEKEKVMRAFTAGELSVLVATTVIEVGVDVANASLMIIENAERMGLSQLHQLRGRVGRGDAQSNCVLLYKKPLGQLAKSRLAVLRDSNDGFVVAQRDLELRGPGEMLGTKQTGLPEYRVADLARDAELMPQVQMTAEKLRRVAAESVPAIIRRWTGDRGRYGKV